MPEQFGNFKHFEGIEGAVVRILSFYNIKGGVGKTATAVNVSHRAAADGLRVLLCDLDPQGAASYYFRIRPSKKYSDQKFLKGGKKIERNIKETDFEGLDLLPSDLSYRNLDIALDDFKSSKKRLTKVLKPLETDYDLIVLDCPPNLTLLSENVFKASDHIAIPLIPTTLSVLTYHKFLDFISGKKIDEAKIVAFFSMVEKRKKMHVETMSELTVKDGRFLKTAIPYSVVVEKMGVHRQPVACFSGSSTAAKAYQGLWDELKMILGEE